MTPKEAKDHFTKLAQEAGLGKDETAAILQAMDNEKFISGISQGYKRHDEYSRGLDEVRAEKARLQNWYEKEELPKYQAWQTDIDKLKRYRDTYGDFEDDDQGLNNGRNARGNANRPGVSKEELDKYFDEKLRQRDAAYVGLTKTAVKISADYTKRFGDTLDVDAVEKMALEKGLSLDQAYKEYIAPKEDAAREGRHQEDIKKAKEEATRDYQARLKIPVDTKPREAHPFYDRKTPDKNVSDLDQDRGSREEFMKGWNDYEAEVS